MAVLNETDLYAPVKMLLEEQGYTVRGESIAAIWRQYEAPSRGSSSN